MIKEGLTFGDVLLKPQYSEVVSRSDIDLSVKIREFRFSNPIIPANMKTIVGRSNMFSMVDQGGLSIMHRFTSIEDRLNMVKELQEYSKLSMDRFGFSIGVKEEDRENFLALVNAGVKIICIDVAHGDSKQSIEMIKWIKERWGGLLIAGNIATGEAAIRMWDIGADVVKCGIGSGAICLTRTETGNGVPQLSALMDVYEARKRFVEKRIRQNGFGLGRSKPYIISDGGATSAGDVVKSLCFADMTMVGNLLSGCSDSPGESVIIDGKPYKRYDGSSTHKDSHVEGVKSVVLEKPEFKETLNRLLQGIKSGCSYQGVFNLTDLKDNPEFIRITNAGLKESGAHDVNVIKE